MDVHPAVDLEQTRLESLVSLVWEDHYSHTCFCETCTSTRDHLSLTDRHFVDHISKTIGHTGTLEDRTAVQ